MTDLRAALFDAVLSQPDQDGPRLVYADHLEEHSRDQADHLRAEFIRVQCELTHTKQYEMTFEGTGHNPPIVMTQPRREYNPRWKALRSRERQLIEEGRRRGWFENRYCKEPGHVLLCTGDWPLRLYLDLDRYIETRPERGFVSAVRCTMEQWYGTPCGQCGGHVRYLPIGRETGGPVSPFEICTQCVGGRVGALAPLLCQAAPLTRVEFSNRQPRRMNAGWIWGNRDECGSEPDAPNGAHYLPEEIWNLLPGKPDGTLPRWKFFPDAPTATLTLSTAALTWGHNLADEQRVKGRACERCKGVKKVAEYYDVGGTRGLRARMIDCPACRGSGFTGQLPRLWTEGKVIA